MPPAPSPHPSPAGVVTTLVTPQELPALQSMAAELGIAIVEEPALPPELPQQPEAADADVEAARRGLEDLFNLGDLNLGDLS